MTMKGVLFNIKSELEMDIIWDAMRNGIFGPVLTVPGTENKHFEGRKPTFEWSSQMAGTFGDLAAIEPGDKVFFFKAKTIYGVGEVLDIEGTSRNPLFLNFEDASTPKPTQVDLDWLNVNEDAPAVEDAQISFDNISDGLEDSQTSDDGVKYNLPDSDVLDIKEDDALYSGSGWTNARIVVPFRPAPLFFEQGIDMDFALSSNAAARFSYLEFFEAKNFSLLSEDEALGLLELLLLVNNPNSGDAQSIAPAKNTNDFIELLNQKTKGNFSIHGYVADNVSGLRSNGFFKKENWVHALAIEALRTNDSTNLPDCLQNDLRRNVFREYPVSPAKPTTWANQLDILTEISSRNSDDGIPTAGNEFVTVGYELIEVKKDETTTIDGLSKQLGQLLKYTDYIANTHVNGHYAALDAYLLTGGYSDVVLRAFESQPTSPKDEKNSDSELPQIYREYVVEANPSGPDVDIWNDVVLLEYDWNSNTRRFEVRELVSQPEVTDFQ
ncbi:hypothetical protein [Haladaptatus sp. DYSN1]|uniref:hypothetical protein n=1 Tax=unclassified Haladaptatus TaxID=2622732 RepID=UPI002406EF50|nr:hypothetical protein [Haladaptatus sp. DYSN1]